ncbi:uncharacterized protein LOC143260421 [Megalopta genalis]|uniref:uncharacterized protein LOC143260421 n=1 Tax=Megalopta genalis TaxID=115081 RepID=UPI003FD40C5C
MDMRTERLKTLISDGQTNGLLTTATVYVLDRDRQPVPCRTLIDTCSNANLMTDELAQNLRLPTKQQTATIEALNQLNTITNQLVTTTIRSRLTNYERTLTFLTIPRIAGPLPDVQIDRAKLGIPPNIKLADPNFHRPERIDMLLGTGPALSCLSIGQYNISKRPSDELILQKTQFGWVIGGSVPIPTPRTTRNTFSTTIQFDLQNFWEVEEGPHRHHPTLDEQECETHFSNNVKRDASGRYMVALPFNEKREQLGGSRSMALKRFLALERRLARNDELREQYHQVINEYLALGHMTQVDTVDTPGFYLPHHAVEKPSSTTTKVRVVFDGAAKSTSGLSLNDTLLTGPTIQDNLFTLLIRFRMHAVVLTADIEKMYRQFIVRPDDRAYQRILWRDRHGEIATFELNTVTFGLSSAPYLAIRCLHQLADDEQDATPTASVILKRDLYVDDLLTGADTIEEAQVIQRQITRLLRKGGLTIRQWASNEPKLLAGLHTDLIHPKILGNATAMKTLGISWDAEHDTIRYSVQTATTNKVTKRHILATIAKIFDPLGLLGPVTIRAKIIMQQLWQLKIDWDESLPANIHTEWTEYERSLQELNQIEFGRHVSLRSAERLEIHGFCDASERAYGACLYARAINARGQIQTSLICAKSRVAPLKTVTLARLELCGAVLLTSLYETVRDAITQDIHATVFWTDSTIVLNWLNKPPSTLKTFVANRVADIQGKVDISSWRHIRSRDNPADLLSRGITPGKFLNNALWRCGPEWLSQTEATWPNSRYIHSNDVPETKKITCLATAINQSNDMLTRYSCIQKLRRIVAYCLRLVPARRNTGPLTIKELQEANIRIIRSVQSVTFTQDIKNLKSGELHPRSKLRPLHPFLDNEGVLRVGGRLQNSTLAFAQKHPILLPRSHHVTDLIIRDAHTKGLHSGITATLHDVRQTYWPIDGRNATRKIVRQCVRCFRVNPPTVDYLMGNLPAARVTESRPFQNSGVDYCGPFYIKERRHRNRTRIKVYVAVFTCFATKAVHLEVAGDLTTDAFMAALKRFVARRGACQNMYSDNGTNFVGADNELREIYRTLPTDERLQTFLTTKGIAWHFTPALSPHFGGLWEAAVKAFKHHLKRVVGEELFTFEQFNTFVVEIEAILNSRPLTPLSPDPNDISPLTPGHFLIGSSLTAIAETDFRATPDNRLSTWQHIQKVKQDFWTRWHKEYIHQLNVRHKWTSGSHHIREGTIVVLKEDNTPPLCWHLGRVQQVHPGADGIIRAVTVRTANGVFKRNVKKLAPLPDPEPSPQYDGNQRKTDSS